MKIKERIILDEKVIEKAISHSVSLYKSFIFSNYSATEK